MKKNAFKCKRNSQAGNTVHGSWLQRLQLFGSLPEGSGYYDQYWPYLQWRSGERVPAILTQGSQVCLDATQCNYYIVWQSKGHYAL